MVQTPVSPQTLFLEVPSDLALQVTPEQFATLAVTNRDLRLERTATGALIVNPPTGGISGHRNFDILSQLGRWFEANESLGLVFNSSTGFELPNGANRSPNASWVRRDRWDALTREQQEGFIPLCPDFVVELRSRSDNLNTTRAKLQEYLDNGAQLGWLIDPQNQRVEIYRPNGEVETLDRPDTLSGEPILSGFVLKLDRIWA